MPTLVTRSTGNYCMRGGDSTLSLHWLGLIAGLLPWLLSACAGSPPVCCEAGVDTPQAPVALQMASARSDPLRTRPLRGTGNLGNGVAVLGVAAATGISDINRNLLAMELARLIREHHDLPVLSTRRVRDALGSQAHDAMQQHLVSIGALDHRDRQRLMAARLPVPVALTLRVTDNRVLPGRTDVEAVRDAQGAVVQGAERVVLSTRRLTRVSVALIDLRNGAHYWQQSYEAQPVQHKSYTRFRGQSLGQSLVAEIATRLSNGLDDPEPPPPPSLQLTLRALLGQVVRELPLGLPAP